MSRVFKWSTLFAVLITGWVFVVSAQKPSAAAPLLSTLAATAAATNQNPADTACEVTKASYDQPAKDPNADSFGYGYWYINADRSIWVGSLPDSQSWHVGSHKIFWIRPQGTQLTVTGHRLDADAAPLHIDIPCCYPTGFQVSGLIFPSPGCWEVDAKAGKHELRFVTKVLPSLEPESTAQKCDSLADVVKSSSAVVVGRVHDTQVDGRYRWHNIIIRAKWRLPNGWSSIGDRFALLQDVTTEPALKEDAEYVLFLQSNLWQIACPQQSIIEKQGDQAIPVGTESVWSGGTSTELYKTVMSAAVAR
jgi:hypothetical protein